MQAWHCPFARKDAAGTHASNTTESKMKTGINSLEDFVTEIRRRQAAKIDVVAPTTAMQVVPLPKGEAGGIALLIKGREPVGINPIAHRQLQSHLKIPADYYDRMLQEQPELLAKNINTWLHANRENRLVRQLFGNARAFLSDKYRPLENEDLAQAVAGPLLDLDADVMSCQITESRLYIKAVDKKVTRELAKVGGRFGDGGHKIVRIASPAITISNSEVGQGALSVLGGVYDSFCSNLATFKERSTRKYHVGSKHELAGEDTFALLSDETRRITDEALWRQVGDIVRAAFDRARFDSLCEKIEATAEDKIEGDVVQVVSFASKRLGFTETEGVKVRDELIRSADLTRFGLYNAVTRVSADLDDYDKASDWERIGGQIIDMPKAEWKELAAAV
jgi:hypothetical protein